MAGQQPTTRVHETTRVICTLCADDGSSPNASISTGTALIGHIHARSFCWYSVLRSLLPHNTWAFSWNLIGQEGAVYRKEAHILQHDTNIMATVKTSYRGNACWELFPTFRFKYGVQLVLGYTQYCAIAHSAASPLVHISKVTVVRCTCMPSQ